MISEANANAGNDEHIHFGMAEDPEEVHPDDGRAAGLRVEEVAAQVAVDQQHDLRGGQRRDDDQNQAAMTRFSQANSGMRSQRHARTAHAEDGGHDVQRRADAADAAHQQTDDPIVGAVSRRKCLCGQRCVGEPADIGSAARSIQSASSDEAEVEDDAAQGTHPETEGIQPRKRHVARADHQGHEIVGEPEQQRHADQENHRRAMHGEQAVKGLRRNKMVVRNGQLDPHDRGFQASDHQKQDAVADVHQAELLVIDGDDPLVHAVEQRPRDYLAGGTNIGFEMESASSHQLYPVPQCRVIK